MATFIALMELKGEVVDQLFKKKRLDEQSLSLILQIRYLYFFMYYLLSLNAFRFDVLSFKTVVHVYILFSVLSALYKSTSCVHVQIQRCNHCAAQPPQSSTFETFEDK